MAGNRPMLIDPLLLNSSHLYPKDPPPPAWKAIWDRLDWQYLLLNVIIPLGSLLVLIFILKRRYHNKQKRLKLINQQQNYWDTYYNYDNLLL